jgi:hypothetical protein
VTPTEKTPIDYELVESAPPRRFSRFVACLYFSVLGAAGSLWLAAPVNLAVVLGLTGLCLGLLLPQHELAKLFMRRTAE